jgi:hypothetical protein
MLRGPKANQEINRQRYECGQRLGMRFDSRNVALTAISMK